MKRSRSIRLTAVAVAVGVLAVPGGAVAAPLVFTTTAQLVPGGLTPTPATTPADLTDEAQYLLSDNGFTYSVRESNGKLGGGVLDYAQLPAAYRSVLPLARWLAEGATGAQPHATCDVAALNAAAVVLGWQGPEPSYGYIPFQATSAGLGDDPSSWLTKVHDATGVTLTPSTNLATACAGIGGTFVAADTVVSPLNVFTGGPAAPLNTSIEGLQAGLASLTAARAAADAQIKDLTLQAAAATVKVASSATLQRGLEVDYTGPPGRAVFVRVFLSEVQRKQLHLRYRTLGTGSATVPTNGKVRVVATPRKDTAPVLLKQTTAVPTTVQAVSGDRTVSLAVDLGA